MSEAQLATVLAICPGLPPHIARRDLAYTHSADATINRFFDGSIDVR